MGPMWRVPACNHVLCNCVLCNRVSVSVCTVTVCSVAVFERLLMPVAREFAPDIVLVSAGFDAALGDPLGRCCLSPQVYFYMTRALQSLAGLLLLCVESAAQQVHTGGRVVLALEGGYNLRSVALSIEACAHALLGTQPPAHHQWAPIRPPEQRAIQETIDLHSSFWTCLSTEPEYPILITLAGGGDECKSGDHDAPTIVFEDETITLVFENDE